MLISKRKAYNRRQWRSGKPAGFTMVEIIVALAILSTSMLAVFGTLRMCATANTSSQRSIESVLLAEKLLAEVSLDEKLTYTKTKGSKGYFSWQIQTAPTAMDNLAAVSVQIQWLDQQRPREHHIYSLVQIPLMEGK